MRKNRYNLHIRLDEDERAALEKGLQASGLPLSAYLRKLILGESIQAAPSEELRRLRTEIHQIGNNINQIARRLNEGRVRGEQAVLTGSEKAEIRALAGLVFTIADQVQEMSRNRRASLKLEVDKALAPLIREARDGAG